MADPVTIAMIGTTLAKTFVDVQAQKAEIEGLQQQAGVRSELADQQFIADTQEANRAAATQRARFAAQGLAFSGSSLLAQEEQASASNFDARLRRFRTLNEGVGLMNEANQARNDRTGSILGSAGGVGKDLLKDANIRQSFDLPKLGEPLN